MAYQSVSHLRISSTIVLYKLAYNIMNIKLVVYTYQRSNCLLQFTSYISLLSNKVNTAQWEPTHVILHAAPVFCHFC